MGFELTRRAALALGALGLTGVAARAANPMKITIQLNGQQQVPPVQTNGTGTANLTYDPSTRKLSWDISYQNLTSLLQWHISMVPRARHRTDRCWYG